MDNENIENSEWLEEDQKKTPNAEEMIQRLMSVNLGQFDISTVADELKGNRIWIPILTVPVSAVILALFTLLGAFLFDQPIVSFVVTAAILFWIGKELERSQEAFTLKARQEVVNRIADIEEGFGLLPHFQTFLPKRYRHLWQSTRKGHYIYIEQYAQAIALLQDKIDHEKFAAVWHIVHPETDPESDETLEDNPPETP